MYGQPWYSAYPSYPANGGFNPYIHPAYARASPYDAPHRGPTPRSVPMRGLQDERAQAIADRRARRARYLPDEDDEMEEYDFWPSQWGPQQSELVARAREEELERLRQEEELRKQEQAELRQRQLEQLRLRKEEEALRRQEELKKLQEEAVRKHLEDERRRQAALEQQQKRREELARRHMEEQEARQRMIEEQKNSIRLKREEEARRLAAADEAMRSRLAEQQRPAAPHSRSRDPAAASHEDNSIPIHFHRSTTPQHTTQHGSRPASPAPVSPKSVHTLEEKNEAASRIQKQYRIHRTYRKLEDLRTQFAELKAGFIFPHVIDFEKPGSEDGVLSVGAYRVPSDLDKDDEEPMEVDNIPEGKLAYTSTNYALNLYSDQLDKLLIKLDGIESYGEKDIREQRRTAVKTIEKEASKLDKYCKLTWLDYIEKQRQGATTTSQPTQQSAPETATHPSEDLTEEAPSILASEIANSSLLDELSTETVSYPVLIETDSNPPSADGLPEPSSSQIPEDNASESADTPGHVEEGGPQAEPGQEGATQAPTEPTTPTTP